MNIEFVIDIPPAITSDAQLVLFTNSWLSRQQNEHPPTAVETEVTLGQYSGLTWEASDAFSEATDIESFGVKTLPGAGSFYFANHEDGTSEIKHISETEG
jgi:hypothetical protein